MAVTNYPLISGVGNGGGASGTSVHPNFASFPVTGTSGIIYVDSGLNDLYLWTGTVYELQSSTGGGTWGSITGTLSSQTDLQTALNAKEDELDWNINPSRQSTYITDFMVIDRGGLQVHASGAGTFITNDDTGSVNTTEGAMGGMSMSSGTDATGRISPFTSGICNVGTNRQRMGLRTNFSILSSANPEYYFTFGVGDNLNSATEISDGVYFKYTHTENGGRWRAAVASSGTRTYLDTGVSPVATVNQELEIDINATGTQALFYIDGTLVATHNSGLPGTTPLVRPHWKLQKIAGAVAPQQASDWFYYKTTRATLR